MSTPSEKPSSAPAAAPRTRPHVGGGAASAAERSAAAVSVINLTHMFEERGGGPAVPGVVAIPLDGEDDAAAAMGTTAGSDGSCGGGGTPDSSRDPDRRSQESPASLAEEPSQLPPQPRPAPRKQPSDGGGGGPAGLPKQPPKRASLMAHSGSMDRAAASGFVRQLENSFKASPKGQEASRMSQLIKSDPNWRPSLKCGTPATGSATLPPGLPGWRVEEGAAGEPRKFLFGEPSMNMGFLAQGQQQQQPSSDASTGAAADPQTPDPMLRRPEISLPVGHLQETRKEGPVKVLRLGGKLDKKSSKSGSKRQSYHLVLTGPNLLLYRSRTDRRPELALNVAAVELDPPGPPPPGIPAPPAPLPSDDPAGPLRLRCIGGGGGGGGGSGSAADSSLSRYADLYPSGDCEFHLHWDETGARKEWSMALKYAKDLLTERMYRQTTQQQQQHSASSHSGWSGRHDSSGGKQRVSIAQRLNDFFRRRPALDELERKGIVRNEPVFGSTLRQICPHERSDVPVFMRRCIEAIESHGLDTQGIYRLGGNAATVQKLRLMVDQSDAYDLDTGGWDIFVLTSALKTFLRELREPMIPTAAFQTIMEHYQSSAKPSAKRESIRQVLRSLPAPHYNSLRLLFQHLTRVVHLSGSNQMSSQNVALMMGPNLVWPAAGDTDGGLCLTTNVMFQNQVVEYILLESDYLFAD